MIVGRPRHGVVCWPRPAITPPRRRRSLCASCVRRWCIILVIFLTHFQPCPVNLLPDRSDGLPPKIRQDRLKGLLDLPAERVLKFWRDRWTLVRLVLRHRARVDHGHGILLSGS